MAQATQSHSPQNLSVQQATADILALVNSSPRTPWPSELEAIIAKVEGEPVIYQCAVCVGRAIEGPSPFCLSHLEPQDDAIVAKARLYDDDAVAEAVAVDRATWRKLVIEAEATLRAKDLLDGDPRLAQAAEAISDAAFERLRAFEASIWERPARSLADLPFLADLLVYQLWPGYSMTEAFPGNDPVGLDALFEEGPWCADDDGRTSVLLRAIRDVIGIPKPLEASDAALLDKVRNAIVREEAAAVRYGHDETDDPRITQEFSDCWNDLHAIQKAIPFPPTSAAQMLCHTEIAFHGIDKNQDGKVAVTEDDCFEGPAARLIAACMAYFGARNHVAAEAETPLDAARVVRDL